MDTIQDLNEALKKNQVKELKEIIDDVSEARRDRRAMLKIAGTSPKWIKNSHGRGTTKVPPIWSINKEHDEKMQILDQDYQQLTQFVYGESESLILTQEERQMRDLLSKFK